MNDNFSNLELRFIETAHKILHLNYVKALMHISYVYRNEILLYELSPYYRLWLGFVYLVFKIVF